jgi:hypothetical protein
MLFAAIEFGQLIITAIFVLLKIIEAAGLVFVLLFACNAPHNQL